MPTIDGKDVSPDEAMLLGRCPECGQPLIPKTARAHASNHWFGRDPNDQWLSEEARRRYKLILDFAAARYNPPADPEGKETMSLTPATPEYEADKDRRWSSHLSRWMVWATIPSATFLFGLERLDAEKYMEGAAFIAISIFGFLYVVGKMTLTQDAPQPRAWPMVLVGLLTWTGVGYVIWGHVFPTGTQRSVPDRPLADDALKWKLQDALGRDLRAPPVITDKPNPNQCQVVIIHDADTYARHLADDLAAVITSSGGNVYVQPRAIDLPDEGIRVFAPKGKQFDCATRFTTRLGMVLGPIDSHFANLIPDHAEKLTPAMAAFGELGNCYEIDIGTRPGS